jgi:hypothetical protein
MQWWLLHAHSETDAKYEEIVTALTKQMDQGKKDIWDCHKLAVDKMAGSNENSDPQQQQIQSSAKTSASEPKKATILTGTIHVELMAGPHAGEVYDLKPKGAKSFCWVGRSTGKKFKDRGISLPLDLEVSTTHGRFEIYQGKLCYTDDASTNGSKLGEAEIEANSPLEIINGMEIIVGQTVMRATLT